jgi:hypothetical protein
VAGYDPDTCVRVARWELREVLLAYEHQYRKDLLAIHRHHELLAVLGGTKDGKMPQPPEWIMHDD